MGKKVKKKGRSGQKEKRVSTPSPRKVPQQCNPSDDAVVDEASVVKERKLCAHLDKGIDLAKISSKIGSSEPIRCEDCREAAVDRRASKGKGKHGKKRGTGSVDSKSESKAIWVCLECGHFACGGVGFPTTPQSHAVRHAKQTRHPLAIQFENPHLQWCFPCSMLIPVEKSEESVDQKDILSDVVKLIKGRSSEGASVDVEDVWFGGGSVTSEIKSENAVSSGLDGRGGYVARGFLNLGNTCFFNSIMQNLLAMDRLRDYFLKLDGSVGPLIIALKKLYHETSPEAGMRNVINPKSFFGFLCAKAPQFRGYQQHDSHELLRSLLDGLSTEELGARKQINSSREDGICPNQVLTFVDSIFGGQLSSTVCCLECGHSSRVYEPFLDLSLPVPTKKPPSKKVQPVPRAKKTKLPPKRGGRIRLKVNKDVDSIPAQSVSNPSASGESSCRVQSRVAVAERMVATSGDSMLSESVGPSTVADHKGSVSQNFSATQEFENKQVFESTVKTGASLDDFAWLDYLEPGTVSDDYDVASQINDISVVRDSGNKDAVQNDVLFHVSSEYSSQVCSRYMEPNLKLESSSVNSWDDELPLQVQGSEVLLLPYKEETSTTGEIMRGEGEASSSVVGCEQEDVLGFDGFGDLFNEPEIAAGPDTKPLLGDNNFQANEVAETGFIAGNSTESDPDEVDNTDSPVSIESCLAYFTKPELLSQEHAWHCENCSKILRDQRMEARKNQMKTKLKIRINGGEDRIQNDPLGLGKDLSFLTEVSNLNNGNIKRDVLNTSDVSLVLQIGKIDDLNQNCTFETSQTGELNPAVSQWEEGKTEMNNALPELSHSSGCYKTCSQASFDKATDSCSSNEPSSIGCNTDKVRSRDSQLLAGDRESEEGDDEEMDSESVKVKRNATKMILINKAPPILTIHLKRFSQDARGRLSKLNGHVDFRETFDLRPYMDPRCTEREKYDYRLVGVVEHLGTMRGGHYVAYVRGGEKSREKAEKESRSFVWYYASDVYVCEASLEEVLRCEAYILFYEQI